MNDKPWMWSVFSREEIDELMTNTSRIVWDQQNGMVIHLSLSNNQCMDFLHHYFITRETNTIDAMASTEFIEGFLFDLMTHIEAHLDDEAPGWQERYYGVATEEDEED